MVWNLVKTGANASGTVVAMPKWGSITYAGGMIDVPKKEFMQGIGIPVNNVLFYKCVVVGKQFVYIYFKHNVVLLLFLNFDF